MKCAIEAVQTDILSVPLKTPLKEHPFLGQRTQFATLLVRVRTSDGCLGFGYVTAESVRQMAAVELIVRDLADRLIGSDALLRGRVYDTMWRLTSELLHEGAANLALAAIDIALWDITGRRANLPLAALLGSYRSDVPVYASHGLWRHASLSDIEADGSRLVAEGFRAVKLRLLGRSVDEDVERVRVLRGVVGDEVSILCDALWSMSSAHAIKVSRELAAYDVVWIEDPVAEDDWSGLQRVRSAAGTPVASGERISRLPALRHLLELEAIDHLILDVHHIGGITPWIRAAAMAGTRGIPISAHIAHEIQLPLLAASPDIGYLEYMPFWDYLYRDPPNPVDGVLKTSKQPGLGLELDERAIERFRVGN